MGGFAAALGGGGPVLQQYNQQQRELHQQTKMEMARQVGDLIKQYPPDSDEYKQGIGHLNGILNAQPGKDNTSLFQKVHDWIYPHPNNVKGMAQIYDTGQDKTKMLPPGPALPGNVAGAPQTAPPINTAPPSGGLMQSMGAGFTLPGAEGTGVAPLQPAPPVAAQPANNPLTSAAPQIQSVVRTPAVSAALMSPAPPLAAAPPLSLPAQATGAIPDIYSVRKERQGIIDKYGEALKHAPLYSRPGVEAQMKGELDALAPLEMIAEKQGQFEQFKRTPEYAALSPVSKGYYAAQASGFTPYAPPSSTFRPESKQVDAERMSAADKVANGIPADAKGPYTTYTDIMTGQPAWQAQPARVTYMTVAGKNGLESVARLPGAIETSDGTPALPTSTLNTRPVGHASMADVLQRQASGETFQHLDGKPLNPESLPKDTAFAEIRRGNQIFYEPYTPGQKTVTVGNMVYPVTEFTTADIGAPGGPQALGPKTVGTASTPISITPDIDGNPVVTGATRTPTSTGAFQRGATAPLSAPVGAAPLSAPVGAPPSSVSLPPVEGTPKNLTALPNGVLPAAALPPGIHLPPGTVTVGQDTVFRKAARPVRALMTQVFGDANNPDIPSMESFAHLADDPAARQRIGTAIRLLQSDESNLGIVSKTDMSGWTAHGGSGPLLPVSVGGGLNGEKMVGSRTLDPKKAAELNAQIGSAMTALKTPEERQAVVASLKAYEEASGLRALISSGGALASIATIQKTLPIIGTNTFSAQDYTDRLKRLAEDGSNGAWGIPPNYFGQDVVNRLNQVRTGKAAKTGAIPPASIHYKSGGTDFDIPVNEISGFLTTHPGAVKQ